MDEAYLELASDMAENSAVARVKAGDNVIVARTFSKLHGLAGLRIGYALARPDIIEKMTTAEADGGEQPRAGRLPPRATTISSSRSPAAATLPRA